jgi:hypothetical protein
MNERSGFSKVSRRMAKYAIITGCIQGLLGFGVLSTMYGCGPFVLLFLMPMVNIAYQWLGENAYRVELWPTAMMFGTIFTFFVIAFIWEFINQLKIWAWKPKVKKTNEVVKL